ncbi:hypothetical protein VB620_00090 [Nodularia harveyana UHCC-0300]|uniref:HEAT repeat domain-containing protein n=1 Tax=Nodularia harveyana UHCC-0300 TaxID=2974287 RepID=A0ABU5UBB0_9CYAN|nr:hypothetical protein [Nodularia harveyana]MEA5579736.1 hypothetical protein [Nodularia harveyana UHCC-0300]
MDYQQEEIKNLESIISELQRRKHYFGIEKATTDSPGKKFECEKEIQKCEQEIKENYQKIELLKNQNQQENSIIWSELSQKIQHIPIQDETIEYFVASRITEPVVDFQWKELVILSLTKLRQTSTQTEDSRTVSTDYVINRLLRLDKSKEQSRALALFALEYLAEEATENELEEKTVEFIIDNAIKTLNENDGRTSKPITRIDKAFEKLLRSSYFAKICQDRLIQSYISAYDRHRTTIGCLFMYTLNDIEVLNARNSNQKLNPLLEKLTNARLVEDRVKAGLKLVNEFFLPHLNNNLIEIDFLPQELLSLTIKILLKIISENVTDNNAVSTTALWALRWLTASCENSSNYTVYRFTEKELDILRGFATNNKQDVVARGWAVLILSKCNYNYEKAVFAQANWIYEWAIVADGVKPQKQLPVMMPLNRPQDIVVLKYLIGSDLPIEGKRSVAIALGRLGCFVEEMIEPLLKIFHDDMAVFKERDEALVYLAFIDNFKVISQLGEEAQEPFEKDTKKYDLPGRCFLALMGIGNLKELQYRLIHSISEQSQINAYAYALAGIANSQGIEVLKSLKNHQKKQVRDAVNDALSRAKEWNANNSNQIRHNSSNSNQDRFLARQGNCIHKLKAKDSTGRWAYYFLYIEPSKEKEFMNALESTQNIDLEDYGKVVGSCYGEKPDEKLINLLKEKYGFEV